MCTYKKNAPGFQEHSSHFADRTGLEPATPCVTGTYSNQLNYRSFFIGSAKIIFFLKEESFKTFFLVSANKARVPACIPVGCRHPQNQFCTAHI